MRRWLTLAALVFAGEAVFALPFVLPRVFRPTVLEAFAIDNTQLGWAFSVYGLVAMVSYGLGGPLADWFPTRVMMGLALICTAFGGVWYATLPALVPLYAFWGLTTVLLFWAGLIRATREWGGAQQGRAYGLLDGGRGLFAAVLATVAVWGFASLLPENATVEDRRHALRGVILGTSMVTGFAGVVVWALVPSTPSQGPVWKLDAVVQLVKRPTVWLQGLIVVCAYMGYKGTDDLSLLASDALGYDAVEAASVGALAFWIRPVAAVAAGLVADRFGGWRTLAACFALLWVADLGVVLGMGLPAALIAAMVGTAVAVYALRGVYFAVFDEGGVPVALTGTAVGLVSVIGYTPDVFMGPAMGYVLDGWPGVEGHLRLFAGLACTAGVGLFASLLFGRSVSD